MFYDINIPKSSLDSEGTVQEALSRAVKYGYRGIAITTNLSETIFEKTKKDKEKKKGINLPDTQNLVPAPPDLNKLQLIHPNVKFFSRINFRVSKIANVRRFFQFKELKKYDLISIEPESQDLLKLLPGIAGIDILSYNPENKCDLIFNKKLYKQLVNQNIYFELMYGPAIVDSTARRNLLTLSHVYKSVGKSQNIIVTSGAQIPLQIRGPYDVMNFNLLFGLSEGQSKNSLTTNCKKLLLQARGRRNGKAIIEMMKEQRNNTD